MLSNRQIKLIHIAKAEASLDDADYRDRLGMLLSGCASSKDPRLAEEHFDRLMAWMEFDHQCRVDAGLIPPGRRAFAKRDYWRGKNQPGNTSRSRYNGDRFTDDLAAAEQALLATGVAPSYLDAIRRRTGDGWPFLAALQRTINSRRRQLA